MASGITIQKNYVSTNLSNINLTNNWSVLVLGVTSQGPTSPTLIQTYTEFVSKFGSPVSDVITHNYVQFLTNNGVPVLFKRLVDTSKLTAATITISKDATNLFTITASDNYGGTVGNNLKVKVTENITTKVCKLQVLYNDLPVETYSLGVVTDVATLGDLLYDFVYEAMYGTTFSSNYVKFSSTTINNDNIKATAWHGLFTVSDKDFSTEYTLTGGADNNENTKISAINILTDPENSFWTKDTKLIHAVTYYPQLRFITTGGITGADVDTQNTINKTLGAFSVACKTTFRVLIDYPLNVTGETLTKAVRNFAISESSNNPAVYAYCGYWGADSNNNWLPGSAGFLSALGRAGYNVYSRRIAGTAFNPGFTKTYNNLYIDAIDDWQDSEQIQLNPIVIIDAQDNLAVMGSSTLAMPSPTLNTKNPAQALDIVLVGDYVTALLNGIALAELESSLDRLGLNALNNSMSNALETFVSSKAITRYDLSFDTTQLGKLGIECVLYFAVGLEEVSLTVTSVYDTTAV